MVNLIVMIPNGSSNYRTNLISEAWINIITEDKKSFKNIWTEKLNQKACSLKAEVLMVR